ncbi:MAG: AAA family ATPase [Planctomycetia bacterium]
MRLCSVTIRNYRMHRELTVAFDPARTVIGGPNETGKTTIVEAAHRALFLRSRVSGEVLESMRSHFHPGHPTVELAFESGGTVYRVTKQFTGTATAPTTLEQAGGPTLRNEEAERKLRDLVAAEAVQGRNVEERLKMQWAHLWVWQGAAHADPLEGDALQEPLGRLRDRLGSLEDGGVMESKTDAAVGRAIAETHAARTRDDGRPRADSPLGRAETALQAARAEVAAAQAAIDVLDGAAATVARADAVIAESEVSLAARRTEQDQNDHRLRDAQTLEVRRAEQQAAAAAATARLTALTAADRQIRECEARIASIEARRIPAAERLAAAATTEREAEDRRTTAQEQARERQQEQARAADLAELHGQAEHLEQRRSERAGLAGRCGRIAALRAEATDLAARYAALPAVTAADLTDLADIERRCDAAQAKVEASGTRIELLSASQPVRLDGRALAVGASEMITADATLEAADVRLRICPGGGTSLAEATRLRDEAAAALAARLRELKVVDPAEARRVQPLRQTLESSLDAKRSAIRDLGDTQAEQELAALDAELAELETVFAGTPRAGFVPPAGLDAAIAARRGASERFRELAAACATAVAAELAAEQATDAAREARESAADAIRTIDDDLRDARVRLAVLVEEHGAEREAAIDAATRDRTAADDQLAATQEALVRLQPDLLRQTAVRLQRAIEKLQAAGQAALADRTIGLDKLRTSGTLDPRADLAQAVANERIAAATHEHAAREARAHALLAELFAARKRQIEARFVAPLANRVTGYLQCLFGADATVAIGCEADTFTSLHVTRPEYGSVAMPFARLSGGAREQVAAAFRLAMAEILAADHDGCLPIVFDDAFVNADAARVAAVQAMLDRAAEQGLQVIVLSCNHRDYDGLGAVTIELPRVSFAGAARPAAADTAPAGGATSDEPA